MKIFNVDRQLHVHEDDATDEHRSLQSTTVRSLTSLFIDDNIDMPLTREDTIVMHTISFHANANDEVVVLSSSLSPFRTLTLTFRVHTTICTIVQFEMISLIIDADGYLALVVRHQQAQRILAKTKQQSVHDGHRHRLHMQMTKNSLQAWLDPAKKIIIEMSRSSIIIDRFTFGSYNQYVGCIEQVIYNDHMLSFEHIPIDRQQCSIGYVANDQIVSFNEFDSALNVLVDHDESFQSFSFRFSTVLASSFLCSLTDRLDNKHRVTLSIDNEHFLFTFNDRQQTREIIANHSIVQGQEHQIMIRIIHRNNFLVQLDQHVMIRTSFVRFSPRTIAFGRNEYVNDEPMSSFVGCIRDVQFNGRVLLKLEHIHPLSRLSSSCQATKSERTYSLMFVCFSHGSMSTIDKSTLLTKRDESDVD
jgi:hypothetical protein